MAIAKPSGPKAGGRKPYVKTVKLIGFGRRVIAALIDFLFITFIAFLVTFLLGFLGLFIAMFKTEEPAWLQGLIVLSVLLVSVLYYVLSWTRSGSTVGKLIVGGKVVGVDGAKLTVGKALLRYFGYLISALALALGFIWVVLDEKRQGWHDKIARTLVVGSDDLFTANEQVTFAPTDPGRKWVWLILYILLALTVPVGSIAGFFVFGPAVARFIANLLG